MGKICGARNIQAACPKSLATWAPPVQSGGGSIHRSLIKVGQLDAALPTPRTSRPQSRPAPFHQTVARGSNRLPPETWPPLGLAAKASTLFPAPRPKHTNFCWVWLPSDRKLLHRQGRRSFDRDDAVLHRLLHLLERVHVDLAHALARDAELVGEFREPDRVLGQPTRFQDASLAIVEYGERRGKRLAAAVQILPPGQGMSRRGGPVPPTRPR